jgi:hypothetical protein
VPPTIARRSLKIPLTEHVVTSVDQRQVRVDPYASDGSPLPLLATGDVGVPFEADGQVQAYNFRLCATSDSKTM